MKKYAIALFAFSSLLPLTAAAQHSSKAAESKPAVAKGEYLPRKAVTLSGQVSADGKSFVSDDEDIWTVSNPAVLSGQEGQRLQIRCELNPAKNEVYVLSAKTALRETRFLARSGDSAFRR
jgi:hypothetical protein